MHLIWLKTKTIIWPDISFLKTGINYLNFRELLDEKHFSHTISNADFL